MNPSIPMAFTGEFLLILLFSIPHLSHARTFSLTFHQKFSEPVKQWMSMVDKIQLDRWPQKGTGDYYMTLFHHDRILHDRQLSGGDGVTFSDGNTTIRIDSLGFLHYASVSLGSPVKTFLVALDTGSDLFWVPCDCSQCAPTSAMIAGSAVELSVYSPNASTTSRHVSCNSSLCELQNKCSGTASHCPYKVAYISDDTSSTGILVDDVLYLTTEDNNREIIKARIIFGCGQDQTGSFLGAAAPNGLLGLGMQKISVPSILSDQNLTADSFSMCFGQDGIGRINFGDKGSSNQAQTPFNVNQFHPMYNITVTELHVGAQNIDTEFNALVDSGTSFTYFADPVYSNISESFNSQTQYKRHQPDTQIPFEYCYDISSDKNLTMIPNITLTMKGGSRFVVFDPIVVFSSQVQLIYCLAMVKSNNLNIIGQNFMTGYQMVFDREDSVLGWKEFNCYDVEDYSTLPVNPSGSSMPPTMAVGPGTYSPEDTKATGNQTPVSMLPPPMISQASHLNHCLKFILLMLIVFF